MPGTHLLIVDPQKDFCDPLGSLFVPGADGDMDRLSRFIYESAGFIDRITVTMDMHKHYHVASQIFWTDGSGANPPVFTIITAEDVENGRWKAANPEHGSWARHYVKTLEKNGRYKLCIWPEHCIAGSPGSCVCDSVLSSLSIFEKKYFKRVDYIFKGTCSLTEHYSALFADVPVMSDPSTLINRHLLLSLAEDNLVLIAGEALSHCVANTVTDIGNGLRGDLSRFVLLSDASSSVDGFSDLGEEFVERARALGMRVSTTDKIARELR